MCTVRAYMPVFQYFSLCNITIDKNTILVSVVPYDNNGITASCNANENNM